MGASFFGMLIKVAPKNESLKAKKRPPVGNWWTFIVTKLHAEGWTVRVELLDHLREHARVTASKGKKRVVSEWRYPGYPIQVDALRPWWPKAGIVERA